MLSALVTKNHVFDLFPGGASSKTCDFSWAAFQQSKADKNFPCCKVLMLSGFGNVMSLSKDEGSKSFDETNTGVVHHDSFGDGGGFAFGVEQLVSSTT